MWHVQRSGNRPQVGSKYSDHWWEKKHMSDRPQRNRVLNTTVLLEGWSRVVRVIYEQFGRDGKVQTHDRDLLARGDGVTVLLYNRTKETFLLLRQPRIVATLSGFDSGETIEACSGVMETGNPRECASREVEEETGHRPMSWIQVGSFYASPGSSLEIVHIFMAEYNDDTRVRAGGGNAHEGEDIELIEINVREAMQWILDGRIRDARTVLAMQFFASGMYTGHP
jgi:GDP-mannose pyrophosphatase NudK